jgi:hypothetical protein
MKYLTKKTFWIGLSFAALGSVANAQSAPSDLIVAAAPATRAEVKMETAEFLKSHRWDPAVDNWVLKDGFDAPAGVRPRTEVRAERDAFLKANRWDSAKEAWVPVKSERGEPPTRTRAQVAAETQQFLKTHEWDETKGAWSEKAPRRKG